MPIWWDCGNSKNVIRHTEWQHTKAFHTTSRAISTHHYVGQHTEFSVRTVSTHHYVRSAHYIIPYWQSAHYSNPYGVITVQHRYEQSAHSNNPYGQLSRHFCSLCVHCDVFYAWCTIDVPTYLTRSTVITLQMYQIKRKWGTLKLNLQSRMVTRAASF